MLKTKNNYKLFILLLSLFAMPFGLVSASTLSLTPEGGTYHVGDTIVVRVIVSSNDQSINAVSSRFSYSQDKISISSISKTGSIISLWAQEPSFSNGAGSASFEGVILNGYTGAGSKVATITFIAKSVGEANINFVAASVLANDGEGTNTLSSQNQATFTILPAEAKPKSNEIVPSKNEIKETIKEVITPKNIKVNDNAPIINYYINTLNINDVALIAIWVILLILMVILYVYYRFRIQKKLEEVKKIAEKSFEILKEDKDDAKALKRDIEGAESVIVSKIEDAEKM
jgi:cbb3-type cytochrome oxidase subunit 3